MENLRSTLRQRESELFLMKSQLADLESVRNSLSDQLVALKFENKKLYSSLLHVLNDLIFFFVCRAVGFQKTADLEQQAREMNIRYQTALEMIGAKEEEIQELRADITDMKEMFRNQVSELLLRIERLQKASS